ncbi:MAG: signal peptidase I [Hyphomicrobiaceae bacterium]
MVQSAANESSGAEPASLPPQHPRSAIIAILLNVFGAGAGYLYLGRLQRAAALAAWTVFSLAASFHGLWGWIAEPLAFAAFAGFGALVLLVSVIDAIQIAARSRDYCLRPFNRGHFYALPVAFSVAVPLLLWAPSLGLPPLLRPFYAPAGSMQPVIEAGDYLMADMIAYRQSDPQRGDIVLVRKEARVIYVKRLMGLPGETIELRRGVVWLNGKEVPRRKIADVVSRDNARQGTGRPTPAYEEVLPEGRRIIVLDEMPNGPGDNFGPVKVPAGHYFFLGDNRDNSADSRMAVNRYGLGFVRREQILGRASFVFWPLARAGKRLVPH